jgi:hypothetical protein
LNNVAQNMNKGGQPIIAPQPIVQSKDSSADIKKL